MARFDRKVERQKSEFKFSKKVAPKKTKLDMFKENFSFRWVKINFRTTIYLIIDFVCIPFLMQFYNSKMAFVLGHGLLTSLLVVLTFYFIGKEKPSIFELLVRYCFMAVVLMITSFIAGILV